jgi:hypothetical protein
MLVSDPDSSVGRADRDRWEGVADRVQEHRPGDTIVVAVLLVLEPDRTYRNSFLSSSSTTQVTSAF